MKKLLLLTVIILISALNISVNAQNTLKEGKVKFEMSYPDGGADAMAGMVPKEMVLYFKNGDTRTEVKMSNNNVVMIRFAKTGDTYTLMDEAGQKIAVKMSKDYMNKFKDSLNYKKPEVKATEETKTIASLKCKKVIVTMPFKGEKKSYVAWVTKDIENVDMGEFQLEGVDGFIMEMTMVDKGTTMHMLCTSVDKQVVPASLFKVPADYKVTSMDEMMKGPGNR